MKEIELKDGRKMRIREATKSDAREIIEYLQKVGGESDFITFGKDEFDKTIAEEEMFIENISKTKNALFILAEMDGKIIGNLSFAGGPRKRIEHVGEFGVTVLKDYWGIGVGTALVKELIQWSRDSGIIRKINLRSRTDNFSAISTYEKLGFVQEGIRTRDLCIDDKFYDSICMGLEID
ncbi:GNAT family N-acetyltransferase [Gudongella sp. DL1XJH-153]|uniref:GNAT family N-acetyltransferase n=1 Tax=Gudongella sp. DL1XJH-153 TaxID=3409804 RepID=UPI003BB5FD59